MRKKAYVFFATGFEETEAIGTTDVLRRGNVETVTVSMTGDRTVTGGHGIPVVTDALFEDIDLPLREGAISGRYLRRTTRARRIGTPPRTSRHVLPRLRAIPHGRNRGGG